MIRLAMKFIALVVYYTMQHLSYFCQYMSSVQQFQRSSLKSIVGGADNNL